MTKITSSHSMRGAGAVVDGLPVVGLWDGDDSIMVTPNEDEGNYLIGADGSAVFSQYIDDSVEVKLKLQPSSPTHRQLTNKLKLQNTSVPQPFTVTVFNLGGNEAGTGTQFFIKRSPDKSLGKNATSREWMLTSCDWRSE